MKGPTRMALVLVVVMARCLTGVAEPVAAGPETPVPLPDAGAATAPKAAPLDPDLVVLPDFTVVARRVKDPLVHEIRRLKSHLAKIEDRIRAAERRTVPTELDRFLNPSFGGNDSATARAVEARAEVAALRLERMELVYKIFQTAAELETRSAPPKPAGNPLPLPPRAPAMDTPPDPIPVRPGEETGIAPP